MNKSLRDTSTHIAIAAFSKGEQIYFIQLSGREYEGEFITDSDKSKIWGQKSLEMINLYRASQRTSLPALKWDNGLHSDAFKHSYNMAEGIVVYGHDGLDKREDTLLDRFYGLLTKSEIDEIVGEVAGEEPSEAVETQFDSWKLRSDHRERLLGDFTHTGIAVY